MKINKKGDFAWPEVGWWIIAIAVLAIMFVAYFLLKGKGINLIDNLVNLFRFGK